MYRKILNIDEHAFAAARSAICTDLQIFGEILIINLSPFWVSRLKGFRSIFEGSPRRKRDDTYLSN